MCVGVPARVVGDVDRTTRQVVVDVQGVRRSIDASLVTEPDGSGLAPGEWVLVHVGFAMCVLDELEAQRTLELLTLLGGDDADFAAFASPAQEPLA